MKRVQLSSKVSHEEPDAFMVFCHGNIDNDYMVFTAERDARDYSMEQEEKANKPENQWPIYALCASDWPMKWAK